MIWCSGLTARKKGCRGVTLTTRDLSRSSWLRAATADSPVCATNSDKVKVT